MAKYGRGGWGREYWRGSGGRDAERRVIYALMRRVSTFPPARQVCVAANMDMDKLKSFAREVAEYFGLPPNTPYIEDTACCSLFDFSSRSMCKTQCKVGVCPLVHFVVVVLASFVHLPLRGSPPWWWSFGLPALLRLPRHSGRLGAHSGACYFVGFSPPARPPSCCSRAFWGRRLAHAVVFAAALSPRCWT